MVNRKLIRPNLSEIKERFGPPRSRPAEPGREPHNNGQQTARRRPAPPDATNAEAFYYLKQMNGQVPMVVVLHDGEELRGHIEWYDRACIKVHRQDGPNLLVFKQHIKYLYKQEEERT
jgi:sRNA-binding regulator protein Hfq